MPVDLVLRDDPQYRGENPLVVSDGIGDRTRCAVPGESIACRYPNPEPWLWCDRAPEMLNGTGDVLRSTRPKDY